MKNVPETAILFQPITELEFSAGFQSSCKTMGFRTLEEIIKQAPQALRIRKGFNYVWLGELITFLNDRKLLHLLQPLPGSNAY
jgi:hypothetical protein